MSSIVAAGFAAGLLSLVIRLDSTPLAAGPPPAGEAPSAGDRVSPPAAPQSQADKSVAGGSETVEKVILAGEVVWLPEAFRRKGVKSYAEEIAKQAVLLTTDGEIVPLVPDWRGRAFFQDDRLRDRPVELLVNRRPGVPWVSVLSIYARDERDKRVIVDYWCDICAIPMYEIKECECCQGPIRLRYRPQSLPRDIPLGKKATP